MDEQFGISRGDVEAAEAETARKLAADRAVELESPALRTYVSENPDAIIDIPLTDLGIDSIAQAFSKLVSTVRLQYKRKVELILCDCFKTFLEERVMKRLKDKLGLEIRSFPPHLHWWNKAEGVIRIIREAAV